MTRGVVKWFNVKKGFGFIHGDPQGKDVFVHYSVIDGHGYRYLKDGDPVEYELVESDKGLLAQHVKRVCPDASPT
ncbi:MAG: cold shock domain-containing protein [Planctomycetota bacterium]